MSFFTSNRFQDRQAAAAEARKAMAEKFLSRPKYDPNDPAVKEREAKRRAVLEARAAREVERERRRAEAAAAARIEAVRQEALARDAAENARRAEEERLEYERKLDRDARYAARKERKKKAKSPFERYR
jgi:hypothetical protein